MESEKKSIIKAAEGLYQALVMEIPLCFLLPCLSTTRDSRPWKRRHGGVVVYTTGFGTSDWISALDKGSPMDCYDCQWLVWNFRFHFGI